MAKALTARAVEQAKPGASRREIPDGLLPGLYLVVQPSGAKSWAIRYRYANKPKKLTLGPLAPKMPGAEPEPVLGGPLTLTGARKVAREKLAEVAAGRDPAVTRKAEKAAAASERNLVRVVADEWLKRDQAGNRSVDEVRRIVNREVLPRWGETRIQDIGRRDVVELLDSIVDRGAAVMARRVHAHLHRMFRWSVARGVIDINPMADLPKPGKETARDRVLTDDELRDVWQATEGLGYPFGPAIRLLILTGARREEIGQLRWREVDLEAGEIRIGGDRTKNGDPHTIPLAPEARAILERLPQIGGAKGRPAFVFTRSGMTPVSGWSKAKARLDAAVAERRGDRDAMPAWRLHDLRRTVATGLQRLGMRLEVIEAVLGHVSGSRAGIVGVYQRHAFVDEKRIALEAWGRHVRQLVDGAEGDNVVRLEART